MDSLAVARMGFGGAVDALARVDRPRGHLAVEEIVSDVAELAEPLVASLRDDPAFIGVGVGVAGIVRRPDGFVRHAPNLGWRDVELGPLIAAALRVDAPVSVANEADLGGLAEHRRGASAGAEAVIYITGEVGVGGNVIIDGRPLVGAAGFAGEVGHIPVNPTGVPCGCGSTGCWETEIGERAMLIRAGRDPDGGPGAVSAVIGAARAGEPGALAAMTHVGTWLGIGLAGLVNVFNPSLIVLGGLFERIHPFVADRIGRVLDDRALPASRGLVTVVPAALGVDAPVLGAAELAFETLLANPATRTGPRRQQAASA